MHKFSFHIVAVFIGLLSQAAGASPKDDAFFENRIRPVLVEKCLPCHSSKNAENSLRVDSLASLIEGGVSGPAIDRENPEQSLLLKAVSRDPSVSAMPPQPENALRSEQIEDFKRWLSEGAHWPTTHTQLNASKLWSLDPPQASLSIDDLNEPVHPIDRLISKQHPTLLTTDGAVADKRTLLRRITYDLTGLPPTYEEVLAFEEDRSDDAYAKCIERLLASPAYGERWGRHWLDVVRYADTAGETADYPVPTAWKYRNYVIQAFQSDKPYDQFIREQIAGDILANQASSTEQFAEQTIATGFLAISRRFGFDSENYHHLTIQDTIDTLGQSFLGLSLGCARCHDHKFDPVPMSDYYAIYGIFDSSRYPFPGSEQKQRIRCLAPLVPPEQSQPAFRLYYDKVDKAAAELTALQLAVPQASLRSLHDQDGDFELQAPAAGGSNGVLVSPWLYQGWIEVTNAAQSPFTHHFPRGKVGVHIPAQDRGYRIEQVMLHSPSQEHRDRLFLSMDWKLENSQDAHGGHRVRIGNDENTLAELHITSHSLLLPAPPASLPEVSIPIRSEQWYNLQLDIHLNSRTIAGKLSDGQTTQSFQSKAMDAFQGVPNRWVLESLNSPSSSDSPSSGSLSSNSLSSDSHSNRGVRSPGLELDNVCLQEDSMTDASLNRNQSPAQADSFPYKAIQEDLKQLVGFDGGFEFQEADAAPIAPWEKGPNSVVRIQPDAQSPFTNLGPLGRLGLIMPHRAEYDGFGRYLPTPFRAESTREVFATFDFCCSPPSPGGTGTWRFYMGHNPGPLPAVELFFNAEQLYRRSGSQIEPIAKLEAGIWYQVRVAINLAEKSYRLTLGNPLPKMEFTGAVAESWDGILDYTFIDSYGNIPGSRPELRVDNYEIDSTAFQDMTPELLAVREASLSLQRANAVQLRQRLKAEQEKGVKLQSTLQSWLDEGPVPLAYAMAEGTPHAVRMQLRGEPDNLGELVPRGFVQALGNTPTNEVLQGSGRLELANWIADRKNPLTSRVMVNRIWQYHFGEGIVRTPNDFGMRGAPPAHQALLDFLALYFMEHGWSIKQLHRLIMTSEAYRGRVPEGPTATDSKSTEPAGYARFVRRRLEAEAIRDAILFVSDGLDPTPSMGHPFPSPTTWGFTQHAPFQATYEHRKRSLYLMSQRIRRHPFLGLFDGADPNASTAKRNATIVPTQSLFFINDPLVHQASERVAQALCQQHPLPSSRVEAMYRKILARQPDAQEVEEMLQFAEAYEQALKVELEAGSLTNTQLSTEVLVWSASVRTLLGSNEFLYVE